MKLDRTNLLKTLGLLLFIPFAVALVRDTVYQGNDFLVFWKAGKHLLSFEPIYSVSRDGAMVFKYPPWIAPFFLPFGFLPETAARWAFGVFNLLCLIWVFRWVCSETKTLWVPWVALVSFWGIWAVHALDGQVGLFILVIALWAGRSVYGNAGPIKTPALLWALSIKVFPLAATVGLRPRWSWWRPLSLAALGFGLLSLPALVGFGGNPIILFHAWVEAALSGGEQFGIEKILGRDNQGMPALLMRLSGGSGGLEQTGFFGNFGAFLLSAGVLGGTWYRLSRRMGFIESWVGWLGLMAAVHPLAWFHLYVWAFPLACIALDRGFRFRGESGNPHALSLATLGVLLVAVVTSKTLGGLGLQLELLSVKAIGVFCLCGSLVISARGARATSASRVQS